ncbi:MAG: efflux RND transporter permease subunit [Desulfobacterales bacterium]|nr:efflux RND transporter permease subunit [Desulfobacterales bacterium]
MKSMIAWFAENHVAANLLMMFIVISGIITGLSIKLEIFPESSLDSISVSVVYKGATPSEIEESIIRKIEEKVSGLTGIKDIDSVAKEGSGSVTIDIVDGFDLDQIMDDVKGEVDRITTFPDNIEKPVIKERVRKTQVLNIAVFGDAKEDVLKYLAERVRDEVTSLEDVTYASVSSVRPFEIHVDITEATLRKFGITHAYVSNIIKNNSFDLPSGSLKTTHGEILIRTKGKKYFARDFENIIILSKNDGSRVRLGDIAEITNGFEEIDYLTRFEGKPAAMINVYRIADQSALTVADSTKSYVEKLRDSLPEGIDAKVFGDRSIFLESRIDLLLKNMMMGLILVCFFLGIFLSFHLALWVTIGIPISFLFGMALLPQCDVSINMISLFAFIMVLGIVVDDAIIIGENIFRRQATSDTQLRGAIDGCIEVGLPVIFSILTTIAAFWPLLLASGRMGKMMRNIPIVIMLVIVGSLVESLLILPSHLSSAKKAKHNGENKEKYFSKKLNEFIKGPYNRFINIALKWRYAFVASGFVILIVTLSIYKAGLLKFKFFPKVESDSIKCYITMPMGTDLNQTQNVVKKLENSIFKILERDEFQNRKTEEKLLKYNMSFIGFHIGGRGRVGETGSYLGQLWIELLPGDNRDISTAQIIKEWRKDAATILEAESITFSSELHSGGVPIAINLSMPDNNTLLEVKNELKKSIAEYNGVFDIEDNFLIGKKELQFSLKENSESLGLNLQEIAQQIRDRFYGSEAIRFQRGNNEVKVIVRYPENERNSYDNIRNTNILTSKGYEIPLSYAAEMKVRRGYSKIKRSQKMRIIQVSADVDSKVANSEEIREDINTKLLPKLKEKYPELKYTIQGEGRNKAESMKDVFDGFIIALFCIYALLAIPFKSFTQPIIIISVIPFGFAGAVWGHIITGFDLSFLSMFGMVGLTGVVVNDSLVLIDAINKMRLNGKPLKDSIIAGCFLRFRAILLTSITTFAGLSPILLEKSLQAQFLIPMAISLGFGVLFATIITLVLIPCFYYIWDDTLNLMKSGYTRVRFALEGM